MDTASGFCNALLYTESVKGLKLDTEADEILLENTITTLRRFEPRPGWQVVLAFQPYEQTRLDATRLLCYRFVKER